MSRKDHANGRQISNMGEVKQQKATGEAHQVAGSIFKSPATFTQPHHDSGSIEGFFFKASLRV